MPHPTTAHEPLRSISTPLLRTGVRAVTVLPCALTGLVVVLMLLPTDHPGASTAPFLPGFLAVAAFATTLALALTTLTIASALAGHDDRVPASLLTHPLHDSETPS
ncbi:hypothetical protein R2Q81_02510 [Microbacterium aquimaris]|uniref:hypothetical protein n=1 Tax=Microbacterium aquimaris TaxID=459816 RepID=UPI002AD203F7|nr:hypothetical protein [Microbacterium aquimaris]MDZ8274814.1 hypothetical protein [Microbacterium aquimaris]